MLCIDSNAVLILNLFQLSSIDTRKTFQESRLPILKSSQDNPQNNFLKFLTSLKHFHKTLQYAGGYPWNIFETEICGIFLEYSRNIAL